MYNLYENESSFSSWSKQIKTASNMSNKNNKELHFKNELYLSDRVKL